MAYLSLLFKCNFFIIRVFDIIVVFILYFNVISCLELTMFGHRKVGYKWDK